MSAITDQHIEWLMSGDTGLSSMTIFAVMTARPYYRACTPFDSSDFGRCYRLLARFPEWRDRLPEVAVAHRNWEGLVREWDELETLYESNSPMFWATLKRAIYR